jgi:hypothetical protein
MDTFYRYLACLISHLYRQLQRYPVLTGCAFCVTGYGRQTGKVYLYART